MRTFNIHSVFCLVVLILSLAFVRSQPGGPPRVPSPPGGPGGPGFGGAGGNAGFGGINPQPFGFGGAGGNAFGNAGNLGGLGATPGFGNLGGFGGAPGVGGGLQGFGNTGAFGAQAVGNGIGANPALGNFGGFGANPALGNLGGFGTNPTLGNLGGFGANPALGNLGGLQAGTPGLGGFAAPQAGFGTNPAFGNVAGGAAGFRNIGAGNQQFGVPAAGQGNIGLRPAVGGAPLGGAPVGGTNALASLFQGQNIGAGMTVDQMRQLDNALFNGGGANIFQSEQPSATFSYPVNSAQYHTGSNTAATNTYTTQQFGGPMGPTPGNPLSSPGSPFGPGSSNLLNSALMGGVNSEYGQQANPAYSSLTSGFNNLLTGVGAGLTNAGRDIASGYAPPNPTTVPTYTNNPYTNNPYTNNPMTTTPNYNLNPTTTPNMNQNPNPNPMNPSTTSPYSGGQRQTLTTTIPGVGTVNLGVPAVSQQTIDTVNAATLDREMSTMSMPKRVTEVRA